MTGEPFFFLPLSLLLDHQGITVTNKVIIDRLAMSYDER